MICKASLGTLVEILFHNSKRLLYMKRSPSSLISSPENRHPVPSQAEWLAQFHIRQRSFSNPSLDQIINLP